MFECRYGGMFNMPVGTGHCQCVDSRRLAALRELRSLGDAGAQDADRSNEGLGAGQVDLGRVGAHIRKPSASGVQVSQLRNSRPQGLSSTSRIMRWAFTGYQKLS